MKSIRLREQLQGSNHRLFIRFTCITDRCKKRTYSNINYQAIQRYILWKGCIITLREKLKFVQVFNNLKRFLGGKGGTVVLSNMSNCLSSQWRTAQYLILQGARSTMTSFVIIRQLSVKCIEFEIISKFSSSMKILYWLNIIYYRSDILYHEITEAFKHWS